MQRHRFVTDIEEDRLTPAVFNRYLVFEGTCRDGNRDFALGVSKAPGIHQQRWLIGVLNALVDTQIAWFEQVLSERRITPADYPAICPACGAFTTVCYEPPGGQLRADRDDDVGAEWMYYFWCRRASEHRQSELTCAAGGNARRGRILSAGLYWLKNELDRCAMTLSESEKQALSALYGDVLQWEIDFHHAAYEA